MDALTLPFSRDAEESLLSACLQSDDAIDVAAEYVEADDFYFPSNGRVFATMMEMRLAQEALDATTMAARGVDRDFLTHLLSLPVLITHTRDYARAVSDHARRRRLMQAGQRIAEIASEETDADVAADKAEEALYGVGGRTERGGPVELRSLLPAAERRIDDAHAGKRPHAVTTPLGKLNDIIVGLAPGTYSILAARPAVGKSAMALSIASHVAKEERVVVFSAEMSCDELVDRMLAAESGVALTNLRAGKVTDEEQVYLHNAAASLARLQLSLDDSVATMYDVRRRVRRMASQGPVGLVVIDYIQLLHVGRGKPNENFVREVAEISRQIKLMAREYNVPVLALSQLSRPEKRYDDEGSTPRPTLASLKESGALEQDADLVMFLHRPQAVSPEVELLVAKHRNGPTGKVMLHFLPHLTTFVEVG